MSQYIEWSHIKIKCFVKRFDCIAINDGVRDINAHNVNQNIQFVKGFNSGFHNSFEFTIEWQVGHYFQRLLVKRGEEREGTVVIMMTKENIVKTNEFHFTE